MKFASFLALGTTALAASIPPQHKGKSLIELAHGETRWVTNAEKFELKAVGKDFIDITHELERNIDLNSFRPLSRPNYPKVMAQQDKVKPMLATLTTENLERDLTTLSEFHNRYYQSETGVQSATWIMEQVQAAVGDVQGVRVERFDHRFSQFSVIATIPGRSNNTVVVGAHQDSINQQQRETGRAPGADDNGSGSVTILEALRKVLENEDVASGNAPNSMEFHWYAGEELGLLGSADIFAQYAQQRRQIKAMLNQDMTGYVREGTREEFGIITDNVDAELTDFARNVVSEYSDLPTSDTRCGYACSDHASANRYNFPAAMVAESTIDNLRPSIHTANDVIEGLNFNHMAEHVKVVVGFMTELAFQEGL
ncbi:leucine aminopeptidase 2 [Coccidioides immitis RS]|uniref:Peptide hydrolase n=4 Tax=Coccidioides TaxID=5500 RepID=J3K5Y3_COCIM|nr:leucine aminopeptidase 2 [Coccidioides immitis RS]XP_003070526.1 leucine aminopeptidase, putative [Coccidioides posadasii C735 delta SOWgp]EFW17973.1 leucine aminopeptidase [Coccidioides posadasii str. Silveira]KMM68659.1 metalloprotease II [Coccidioides posadasii RMSCC 3488]EAS29904.3 leucine aminopeptidase 2 [Coccidioides immitis RS]EER28381.1 leucine aminopeptidase, putative [Coccidioides posadasii C735 delta SOWgp]QVM10053.1 Leucine aminopeptidase 1 [Coccidioides posadasii str. Silveir|eukprot:XP_003070526.1 leucine aminopeptidase, putative [Coccidioides posadasii C735 delta SOWgp]